ncbi:MAG: DNA repair protein RecO [Deltaproteobacteria bacterium]
MKSELQTRAVVLREMDHGDSDKIITFYGVNSGRLTCIAKGAKRSKKRFVNKLEMFTALDLTYVSKMQGLSRLEHAETVAHYPQLRSDSRRYLAACLIAELLLYWVKENDPDPKSFALVLATFSRLAESSDLELPLILFFNHFLASQGYRPVLDVCANCGKALSSRLRYTFQPSRFGVVCEICTPMPPGSDKALSLASIKLLHHLQSLPADRLERFHFNRQTRQQVFAVFRAYFVYLLQRDIHSWSLAEKMLWQGNESA